jgi:lipopolysaccharide/colanic/teichoic acid biosynthesis glycosyltransferase
VGKFFRATRLDELPQLINIFVGDMSIVGPRPERESIAEEYVKELPEFRYRLKVKAGLTGLAQIMGKYNTTPKDKLTLDLVYIEQYSVWLDLKLMFQTLKVLFKSDSTEGVDADHQVEFIKHETQPVNTDEE